MNTDTCTTLLESHAIKPTSNRIVVLKALAASEHPSSMSDLERQIVSIDKSGIFRALRLFSDHHLVHTIEDGDGGVRYELCLSHSSDTDDDQHVHFFCERCHKVYCLYDIPVPLVAVPRGFSLHAVNYLLKGICEECERKKKE